VEDPITELKRLGNVCGYAGVPIPPLPVGVVETDAGRFCINIPGTGFSDRPFHEARQLVRNLAEGWRAAHIASTHTHEGE
jgi:hypothetical protein